VKLTYNFIHMDSSTALIEFASERLGRMEKFELKPLEVRFSFSMLKHQKICDVLVAGAKSRFKAKAAGEDIYVVVEEALEKLEHQLQKRKDKVQHHKNKNLTKEAHLRRMSGELVEDFSKITRSKKGLRRQDG
jgi:putative sigma-54 modulation protein